MAYVIVDTNQFLHYGKDTPDLIRCMKNVRKAADAHSDYLEDYLHYAGLHLACFKQAPDVFSVEEVAGELNSIRFLAMIEYDRLCQERTKEDVNNLRVIKDILKVLQNAEDFVLSRSIDLSSRRSRWVYCADLFELLRDRASELKHVNLIDLQKGRRVRQDKYIDEHIVATAFTLAWYGDVTIMSNDSHLPVLVSFLYSVPKLLRMYDIRRLPPRQIQIFSYNRNSFAQKFPTDNSVDSTSRLASLIFAGLEPVKKLTRDSIAILK